MSICRHKLGFQPQPTRQFQPWSVLPIDRLRDRIFGPPCFVQRPEKYRRIEVVLRRRRNIVVMRTIHRQLQQLGAAGWCYDVTASNDGDDDEGDIIALSFRRHHSDELCSRQQNIHIWSVNSSVFSKPLKETSISSPSVSPPSLSVPAS